MPNIKLAAEMFAALKKDFYEAWYNFRPGSFGS
jgi:hypothetical protein